MPKSNFHNVLSWAENEEDLVQIQRKFLPYLPAKGKILDIGSGRGIFLHLLEENGFESVGVEYDALMYKVSSERGCTVHHNDALSYLRETKEKYNGIIASHIIEHLPIDEGMELLNLVKSHLRPGGVAIVVTPRPGSLWAVENFWLDSTHVRPYPLELMKKLLEPLEIVEGGIEPDSRPLKLAGKKRRAVAAVRRILVGPELFDFAYGGGVWWVVARKND